MRRNRRLQLPLYMLALRDRLGLEPVGGVYRGIKKGATRGLLRDAERDGVEMFAPADYLDEEAFWGLVAEAVETARSAVARIRRGDVRHDPTGRQCPAWCDAHPICRVGAAVTTLTELSDAQQAAVDARGIVLVSAGAGSGKTTMLVERAAREVENGVDPESVFVVTFTERAAGRARRAPARPAAVGRACRSAPSASPSRRSTGCAARSCASTPSRSASTRSSACSTRPRPAIIRGEALEQALTEAAESDDGATLDLLAAFGGAPLRQLIVRLRDGGSPAGSISRPPPPPAGDLEGARVELAEMAESAIAHYAAQRAEREQRTGGAPRRVPARRRPPRRWSTSPPSRSSARRRTLAGYKDQLARHRARRARRGGARAASRRSSSLVQRFDRVYAARKSAAAALDFADLELRARDLLVSDADARCVGPGTRPPPARRRVPGHERAAGLRSSI